MPLLRQGEAIGTISIWRDVVQAFTDEKIKLVTTLADQAVIAIENVRLFQEIQDKSRQLETANERLKELDRLKSDFVSNVSHELRTPLTAIKGAVSVFLREVPGRLNENQTHYLTRVRSNTQHLAGLINDLLDLAKIEEGKVELKGVRVSVGGLVHEVMETVKPLAGKEAHPTGERARGVGPCVGRSRQGYPGADEPHWQCDQVYTASRKGYGLCIERRHRNGLRFPSMIAVLGFRPRSARRSFKNFIRSQRAED